MVIGACLLGIALPVGSCIRERFHRLCRGFRLQEPGIGVDVDTETPRIAKLRYQANIGERRGAAEAKRTWLVRDQLLARPKPLAIDPGGPGGHRIFAKTELAQP